MIRVGISGRSGWDGKEQESWIIHHTSTLTFDRSVYVNGLSLSMSYKSTIYMFSPSLHERLVSPVSLSLYTLQFLYLPSPSNVFLGFLSRSDLSTFFTQPSLLIFSLFCFSQLSLSNSPRFSLSMAATVSRVVQLISPISIPSFSL